MSRVEPAELGEGQRRYGSAPVGRALEGRVVEDDDLTVPGGVHVELEHVDAVRERPPEGWQRVLGRDACGTAMAEEAWRCSNEAEPHERPSEVS